MLWLRWGNTIRNWGADRPGAPGCGSRRRIQGHVPTSGGPIASTTWRIRVTSPITMVMCELPSFSRGGVVLNHIWSQTGARNPKISPASQRPDGDIRCKIPRSPSVVAPLAGLIQPRMSVGVAQALQ
jgi:hypothetical protein